MNKIVFQEIFDSVAACIVSKAFPIEEFCFIGVTNRDIPNVLVLNLIIVLSYLNA